jgi:hypothetical protein
VATTPELIQYFRSLELALDEHRDKGTPQGDPVYQRIYNQRSGDVAALGIGKDQIGDLAKECGHESTIERLEKLMKKPIGFK